MKKSKKLKEGLIAVLIVAVIIIALIHLLEANHWKKFIPEKLNVTFLRASSSGRPHPCDVAIFWLSGSDAEAIKKEGLKFFEDDNALYPRESKRPRFYEWSITPVSASWFSEGANSYPCYCSSYPVDYLLKSSGNFIGSSSQYDLIVDPDNKKVFLIFVDW